MSCAKNYNLLLLIALMLLGAPAWAFEAPASPLIRISTLGGLETTTQNTSTTAKWQTMLERFRGQLDRSRASDPRYVYWKQRMVTLSGQSMSEKIEGVNAFINQARYISDDKNWAQSDHWATPMEFFNRGGDCEDFAIAKYFSLRVLGVPDENLRVAIVNDRFKNMVHAVLLVHTDEGTLILDNQNTKIVTIEQNLRYRPILSFNQRTQWLHSS